jgi:hypothetical protein
VKGSRYPLEALRRIHQDRAERAHAAVAARLRECGASEEARRLEEQRLGCIDQQIAAEDLPSTVLELRALAAMSAHRSRLCAHRTRALEAVTLASGRAGVAHGLLDRARAEQRSALLSREAVETHHSAWRRARLDAVEAAEERALDDAAAVRSSRAPP